MKASNEWVRQTMVDEAADELVTQRACDITEIKPYDVATYLKCHPNGALSSKVYDWRKRRLAAKVAQTIEVPAQAEAEFRSILDRFAEEAMGGFMRTARSVGSDIDRAAALRIADAERRRDQAEAELMDMVQLCQQTEQEVAGLENRAGELENELQELRSREQRLLGRLEQQEADARSVGAKPNAPASPEAIGAGESGPVPSPADEPPAVETEQPSSTHAEPLMPYVGEYGDDAED